MSGSPATVHQGSEFHSCRISLNTDEPSPTAFVTTANGNVASSTILAGDLAEDNTRVMLPGGLDPQNDGSQDLPRGSADEPNPQRSGSEMGSTSDLPRWEVLSKTQLEL